MTRHAVIPLAAALCAWTAVFPVEAHHSYGAFYDLCKSVTIEGRVAAVQWKAPHVYVELTLDDGTAYRAEWTSRQGLSRTGVTADVLKVGDRMR
jgi:hypothetical protein